MRTLTFRLNGFPASVSLPEHFFDEHGTPRWHLLNARFSSPFVVWDKPIGAVAQDEQATQEVPNIVEELTKLREVAASLENKFKEVR